MSSTQTPVWIQRLQPAVDQPGQWVKIGAFSSSARMNLLKGRVAKPDGNWEFKMRAIDENGSPAPPQLRWLYARMSPPVLEFPAVEPARRLYGAILEARASLSSLVETAADGPGGGRLNEAGLLLERSRVLTLEAAGEMAFAHYEATGIDEPAEPRRPRPRKSRVKVAPEPQGSTSDPKPSESDGPTATERSQIGRLGPLTRLTRESGEDMSAPARAGFLRRFEQVVDPEHLLSDQERARRADAALRLHMSRLARKRWKREAP